MTKRKGKAKRTSQRHARKRASFRMKSQELPKVQTTTGELILNGDGKGVMQDESTRRADANLASRMISLGVVSDEQAAQLLRRAHVFAAKATEVKDYKASMDVILATAKLKQNQEKISDRTPSLHLHQHNPVQPNDADGTDVTGDIRAKIAAKIGLRRVYKSGRR